MGHRTTLPAPLVTALEVPAAVREALAVLAWYADEKNWTQMASWGSRIHDEDSDVMGDYGRRARAALARLDAARGGT